MPKKKKPYQPNNWQLYKDSDDSMFIPHEFDEFMDWKLGGWELPSSVCCIIRETDPKTKKVKEHVYSKRAFAVKKIDNLMDKGKEFTIVDEVQIHQMYPKDD
tara:strand:- start:21 stop:326 length:306 start_codon:yes stop_codon:yes gene_type:complete